MTKDQEKLFAELYDTLREAHKADFSLWDGEILAVAHISCGAHGFFSGALVFVFCDSPLEVKTYDGYKDELSHRHLKSHSFDECIEVRYTEMLTWLVKELDEMCEPKGRALEIGTPKSTVTLDDYEVAEGLM